MCDISTPNFILSRYVTDTLHILPYDAYYFIMGNIVLFNYKNFVMPTFTRRITATGGLHTAHLYQDLGVRPPLDRGPDIRWPFVS